MLLRQTLPCLVTKKDAFFVKPITVPPVLYVMTHAVAMKSDDDLTQYFPGLETIRHLTSYGNTAKRTRQSGEGSIRLTGLLDPLDPGAFLQE